MQQKTADAVRDQEVSKGVRSYLAGLREIRFAQRDPALAVRPAVLDARPDEAHREQDPICEAASADGSWPAEPRDVEQATLN